MADAMKTLARLRVPLGFAGGVAALVFARPTMHTLAVGGAIACAGEAFRVWAAGHLEKGREVTRSGPYRLTHHPLYAGSAAIGVGVAVASGRWAVAVLVAVCLGSTLLAAIRTEETGMRAAFGEQYVAYLESRGGAVDRPFSAARAWRNREYRAMTGLVVAWGLLALKAVFLSN